MAGSVEQSFLAWFRENGGWIDERCDVREIPNMGRGLIAKAPIAENERVFAIPRSMLMNLTTSHLAEQCVAAERDAADAAADAPTWATIMERGWCPLILMLMWEHWRAKTERANSGISWGPYFDIMPDHFSTPMFWSDDEVEALRGTDIIDKIGKADAEADYRDVVLPYIRRFPELFVGLPHDAAELNAEIARWYSVDMYHRMGSSILSRSFHVKRDLRYAEPDEADVSSAPAEVTVTRNVPDEERNDEPEDDTPEDGSTAHSHDDDDASESSSEGGEEGEDEDVADISMVPMADMLNARFASENTRLFYKKQALEMRCTKPIAEGEQLLNTYGNPPNSDLVRRYGFIDEPNRGDLVELPAERVVDTAVGKLCAATQGEEGVIRAAMQERFEWACTELGVDEVFLLSRLSKPQAQPPYGSTLALDPAKAPDASARRALTKAVAEVPEELVSFARLLCVNQSAFTKAQKRSALPNARLEATEEVEASWLKNKGTAPHVAVASVLLDAVRARLAGYPESLEELHASLYRATPAPSEHRRMAMVVCAGDQVILREHMALFSVVLAVVAGGAKRAFETPGSVPSKKLKK